MSKPNTVTTRVESIHVDKKQPGGFVDVKLWLNHDRDILAHVEARMWFSREDVDLSTIRKAAIQQALRTCGQISELSNKEEVIGIPDKFWCAMPTSRPGPDRI